MSGGDLPVRPRRRAVNPVSVTLCGVLLLAAGFIGGVEVQKKQGGSSGGGAANAAARFGARAGQFTPGGSGGAAASNATVGQVADVHGKTLYVTGSDGTTVKVKTNANTKVTRNAVSKVKAVHPGDTVVVQGSKSGASVKASRVSATASNASAGGLFGGAGGGFGGTQQGGG